MSRLTEKGDDRKTAVRERIAEQLPEGSKHPYDITSIMSWMKSRGGCSLDAQLVASSRNAEDELQSAPQSMESATVLKFLQHEDTVVK